MNATANMVRWFMKNGDFPRSLGGGRFFTAAYVINRAPHSALGNEIPFKLHYSEEANLTHLRAIGAHAFVHIETHTKNLEDKAWEGKLSGYSPDSNAYRIYNPVTRNVLESRNAIFIEPPRE